MKANLRMHKHTTYLVAVTAALALLASLSLLASSASAASTVGDPTVNKHTRYYVNQMAVCQISVELLRIDMRGGKVSLLNLADEATSARDTCDAVRDNLSVANTDHFDDQATEVWYGVDRYKSGLNAFLAFVDSLAPSKAVETRNKLQQGDAAVKAGVRGINQRRKVYGLVPIKGF